jgi:hypothetical protein
MTTPGMALGKAECGAHIVNQALVGNPAVILEQGAIKTEIDAQHLGNAESDWRPEAADWR